MTLLEINNLTVALSAIIFLIVTLILVIVLLVAKHYLVASGKVKLTIYARIECGAYSVDTLLSTVYSICLFLSSA